MKGRWKCTTWKWRTNRTRGLENERLENDRQISRGLENAGLENDGQLLAISNRNYRVWKMQDKFVGCTWVGKIDSCIVNVGVFRVEIYHSVVSVITACVLLMCIWRTLTSDTAKHIVDTLRIWLLYWLVFDIAYKKLLKISFGMCLFITKFILHVLRHCCYSILRVNTPRKLNIGLNLPVVVVDLEQCN